MRSFLLGHGIVEYDNSVPKVAKTQIDDPLGIVEDDLLVISERVRIVCVL